MAGGRLRQAPLTAAGHGGQGAWHGAPLVHHSASVCVKKGKNILLRPKNIAAQNSSFFSESDLQNLGWVKYYNFETQCLPSFDANRNKRRPLSGLLLRDCCQGVQRPLASGSRHPARACQRQRRPCQPPLGPEGWHDLRVNSAAPAVMSSVSGPVTGTASNTP